MAGPPLPHIAFANSKNSYHLAGYVTKFWGNSWVTVLEARSLYFHGPLHFQLTTPGILGRLKRPCSTDSCACWAAVSANDTQLSVSAPSVRRLVR
jgi:hypothetical protein